jgi:DNA-binding SARP family transcriptional activator
MEFRVLGPLEASDGQRPLRLAGQRQRALLARLVLDLNRTVPVPRLVDDLWGEDVPASAVKMVQIAVSQLRKVLPAGMLLTRPPGYALVAEPESVDAIRFGRLRERGRAALAAGDAEQAAALLEEALGLWRGAPLAEFDQPFARVEAAHLEELRLACREERIEAGLALGRLADAIAELEGIVAAHPLREAPHGQLMLALYRAGRQAEALAAYDRFRRRLDDELGLEPTAALKELQRRILTQDAVLEPQAAAPAPVRRARPRSGLVGRDAELAVLEDALATAGTGHGRAVLVTGPAGIGKSRLVAELADRAGKRGATVLTGRCLQLIGAGLPFLPLVEALRPLQGAAALEGLHELARLMPGAIATAPPGDTPAGARLRLFEEVLALVGRLGADTPVVLVLEDLHWADDSTLDVVAFLVNAAPVQRLLFVATYRSDEVRADDPLQRLATGLVGRAAAVPLALEPLPPEAVRALLADGGEPLPDAVAEEIVARADGNPFFAGELRAAAARGGTALSPALRDVLLAKVAQLDGETRAVLRVAAAAGRDVSYALLAAVLPLGELELAEALRTAVEHGVLEPDHDAGSFRFRHALIAEAVRGTLLPGERELVHERLARALSEAPRLAAGGAAEEAHHWVAAGRPVEALEASLRAAREAERVSGLSEALRHVERVLELWESVPQAEELAGLALPSVLDWAAALVGSSSEESPALAVEEARRLYPSAVVLESLAVRVSPPFGPEAIAALRQANAAMLDARGDASAAAAADDEFHHLLTRGCGNAHLLAAVRPIKRALLRYERVYMVDPARIERSAAQHEAIVATLEAGDHATAAQLVRHNLSRGLPDLTEALEP